MRRLALKTDQQGLKFVNPCERSLTDEAVFVHDWVEMPFPSALDRLSVAFVFRNVRFDASIPQQLPCCSCVKATIHVEEGAPIVQPAALHGSEHVFELLLKHIAVVMVASNHPGGGNNIAVAVSYRQDVACLSFLSALIRYFFAPFLQHYGCHQG